MVVQQIGWDGDSAVRVFKFKTLIILIHVQVWAIGLTSCFVYSQGASYDPSGMNYRCPCCDKQTPTMQASFFYFTYGQLDRRRDDLFTGAHAAHEREDAVQVGGVRHRAEHGAARVLM